MPGISPPQDSNGNGKNPHLARALKELPAIVAEVSPVIGAMLKHLEAEEQKAQKRLKNNTGKKSPGSLAWLYDTFLDAPYFILGTLGLTAIVIFLAAALNIGLVVLAAAIFIAGSALTYREAEGSYTKRHTQLEKDIKTDTAILPNINTILGKYQLTPEKRGQEATLLRELIGDMVSFDSDEATAEAMIKLQNALRDWRDYTKTFSEDEQKAYGKEFNNHQKIINTYQNLINDALTEARQDTSWQNYLKERPRDTALSVAG